MSLLTPSNRKVLATAVVDTLVVDADPDAPQSGLYYWETARPWRTAVVDAVTRAADDTIRTLGRRLVEDPTDPARYLELRSALLTADEPATAEIFELAWRAECNSRLAYHQGPLYTPDALPVTVDELRQLDAGTPLPDDVDAPVLIVVPFRDRDTGGARLRNLLACLLTLRDQSFPREGYRVVVVESDDHPRWRDVIAPFTDHYLFAEKAGSFNKSWAVNVGVENTPGNAEVISIHDGDVLADRDFVARNAARFRRAGTMGHLTYRNMLCLDNASSAVAIRERLHGGAPAANPDRLRGFALRRGPGCSLWVRADAYRRIGGMDERFEGWGGEDIDFNYRFDFSAAYDSYDDPLIHLRHPPASALRSDGELVNAHIPPLSWRPEGPIGQVDRFAEYATAAAA
jgi:hypothetical protein